VFPRRRIYAPVLVCALALVAGCGDSGNDDSGGPARTGGSDEQQIRTAVEGLYEDLGNYDAASVCKRMSPSAQRQIARGAIAGAAARGSTCPEAFGKFLDLAKKNGGLKRTLTAKVGKIDIDGEDALVTVSFGAQSGQVPLSKIRGEWKMGVSVATPSAEPPASPRKK
jgi:hypothetical protein